MKKISKILSVMLIVVLAIASLNLVAIQADDSKTSNVTINETKSGHTYNAYRLFSGDSTDDGTKNNHMLSNIHLDSNIEDKKGALITALKEGPKSLKPDGKDWSYPNYETLTPQAIKDLKSTSSVSEIANAISKAITEDKSRSTTALANALGYFFESQKVPATKTSGAQQDGNKYVIEDLPEGYYVIIDEDAGVAGESIEGKSAVMLIVTDQNSTDTTIDAKAGATTATKKIVGTKKAYSVGDEITFIVTVEVPENAVDFAAYNFELIDTMTNLTYKENSFEAYVGKDVTSGNNIANHFKDPDWKKETKVLTITHKSVGDDIGEEKMDTKHWDGHPAITLKYVATLDEGAITQDANNSAVISYTDDPDQNLSGSSANVTPDPVNVFTHNLRINKQNDGGGELDGATFTVDKWLGTNNGNDSDWKTVDPASGDAHTFNWNGIGDGIYRIKETVAPDGYNKWQDGNYAYLQVTTVASGDTVDTVTATLYKAFDTGTGRPSTEEGIEKFTYTKGSTDADGVITANIKNYASVKLPETGGMGTKIFYTLGGLLAAAAIVLLVVRRRMRAE